MRLVCSISIVLVLAISAWAQEPPKLTTIHAASDRIAELQFTQSENKALTDILAADQEQQINRQLIAILLKETDTAIRSKRLLFFLVPKSKHTAVEQRAVALSWAEDLARAERQLKAEYNAWLAGVQERAKCVGCQPDLQQRKLIEPPKKE